MWVRCHPTAAAAAVGASGGSGVGSGSGSSSGITATVAVVAWQGRGDVMFSHSIPPPPRPP
jgi:hypothetical protein